MLSGCYLTGYKSVLEARGALYALHDAAANNAPPETLINLADAALQADPWDADLALQVAHHPAMEKSEALLIKAQDKRAAIFVEAVRRNPRSARLYEAMGDWENDAPRAITSYENAIARFPTNAALYAKLAATQFAYYKLIVRRSNSRDYLFAAARNAETAIPYDVLNPHADRKLAVMKFTNRFTSVNNLEEHMREIQREWNEYLKNLENY